MGCGVWGMGCGVSGFKVSGHCLCVISAGVFKVREFLSEDLEDRAPDPIEECIVTTLLQLEIGSGSYFGAHCYTGLLFRCTLL